MNPSPCTDRLSSPFELAKWMSAIAATGDGGIRVGGVQINPVNAAEILKLIRPKHNWARLRAKWKVRNLIIYWDSLRHRPDRLDMAAELLAAMEGMEGAVAWPKRSAEVAEERRLPRKLAGRHAARRATPHWQLARRPPSQHRRAHAARRRFLRRRGRGL